IQPGPKANFQNVPGDAGKELLSVLRHEGRIQGKVAETRKDYSRVEAHEQLLIIEARGKRQPTSAGPETAGKLRCYSSDVTGSFDGGARCLGCGWAWSVASFSGSWT